MRMFICTIGYQEYALTPDAAVALMQGLAAARLVKRSRYDAPYEFQPDDEAGVITEMRLAEVVEPPPPAPAAEPLGITHQPLALAPPEMPF